MDDLFKEVVKMIRELQWVDGHVLDDGYVASYKCADCGAYSQDDHERGCELNVLLKKLTSLEMSLQKGSDTQCRFL